MSVTSTQIQALDAMQQRTVVVIPVYLPATDDAALAHRLLRDNVAAFVRLLGTPEQVCLAVDGQDHGGAEAAALTAEFAVRSVTTETNMGKLHALRSGVAYMREQVDFDYLAAVDMDGDHFAHELPNMIRAAQFAQNQAHMDEVLVLGSRASRHRPMGFYRGELEELADRVLLDALQYHAAITRVPLRLECATAIEEYPDFHSGYKLYTRDVALAVFTREVDLQGVTEEAYFRHGVEAVMSTEAILSGAHLVVVRRSTINEQPVSSFGLMERTRLVADKMVWPCKRLGIPPHVVDQWLRNHLPRLLLNTLAPQGKEELLEIRRLVMRDLGVGVDDDICWGPPFV